MQKKQKPILIIDSREKNPFDFNEDQDFDGVIYRKLEFADYSLEGYENLIAIERKASGDELLNNFLEHKDRFHAEMERMKSCKIRIIVVEQTLDDLMNPMKYFINIRGRNKKNIQMPVAVVMSNLMEVMLRYNVIILFAGTKAKSLTKRILLSVYDFHNKGLC